jgi:hypothetical protein
MIFTKDDRLTLQNIPCVITALHMRIEERLRRDVELSKRYEQETTQWQELTDRRWKLLNERLDCQALLNDFLLGKLREDTGMQNAFSALENRLVEHHNAYAALLKEATASQLETNLYLRGVQDYMNVLTGASKARHVKRKKEKR